jgi:hypothetical protein
MFRAVTSQTRIRSTFTSSGSGGVPLHVSGTDIGCYFLLSHSFDPGHKAVYCTDIDARGPAPGSDGFAISDRYFATISVDSHRTFQVERRLRHAG